MNQTTKSMHMRHPRHTKVHSVAQLYSAVYKIHFDRNAQSISFVANHSMIWMAELTIRPA